MLTSVWSMLYSRSVCREIRLKKRLCLFQQKLPKTVVYAVLTQLNILRDYTGVCCLKSLCQVPRLLIFSLEAFGSYLFLHSMTNICHTSGNFPARWFIIINMTHNLVLSNFLNITSAFVHWVVHSCAPYVPVKESVIHTCIRNWKARKSVKMLPNQLGISISSYFRHFLARIYSLLYKTWWLKL